LDCRTHLLGEDHPASQAARNVILSIAADTGVDSLQ